MHTIVDSETLHQAITVPKHTLSCTPFSTAHIQLETGREEKGEGREGERERGERGERGREGVAATFRP